MLRSGFLTALLSMALCGNAIVASNFWGQSDFFSPNTTIAQRQFLSEFAQGKANLFSEDDLDTTSALRVIMFNYSAYDSIYANKIERCLRKNLPNAQFRTFWKGTAADLEIALADRQVAVLPYPARGESDALRAFGAVLSNFARAGGLVIFTGTHEHDVLRQLGLLELDYGYYFAAPAFRRQPLDHPISKGIPGQFTMTNYAYPLDVSDPDFVSLADVNGYASVGYKMKGRGAVAYLGMEYYYDEPISTRLLVNAVQWGSKFSKAAEQRPAAAEKPLPTARPRRFTLPLQRDEYPEKDSIGLKIFPNPFVNRADVELAIGEPTLVSLEITDQTGQPVSQMISRKTLAPGKHVLELPNLPPGVYYVKCKCGNDAPPTMRRIVKLAAP